MGTLVCTERHRGSVLQQELTLLNHFLSVPLVEIQDCVIVARSLHSQFACIEMSAEAERMSQAGEKAGIMDIKKNL